MAFCFSSLVVGNEALSRWTYYVSSARSVRWITICMKLAPFSSFLFRGPERETEYRMRVGVFVYYFSFGMQLNYINRSASVSEMSTKHTHIGTIERVSKK